MRLIEVPVALRVRNKCWLPAIALRCCRYQLARLGEGHYPLLHRTTSRLQAFRFLQEGKEPALYFLRVVIATWHEPRHEWPIERSASGYSVTTSPSSPSPRQSGNMARPIAVECAGEKCVTRRITGPSARVLARKIVPCAALALSRTLRRQAAGPVCVRAFRAVALAAPFLITPSPVCLPPQSSARLPRRQHRPCPPSDRRCERRPDRPRRSAPHPVS